MIRIRYFVNNVQESVEFYTKNLGFEIDQQFGDKIALLKVEGMILILSSSQTSAAQPMLDGSIPEPGGWNRFLHTVHDIESTVAELKENGVKFKNNILSGPGGSQALCEDPSGNVIEIFQPA